MDVKTSEELIQIIRGTVPRLTSIEESPTSAPIYRTAIQLASTEDVKYVEVEETKTNGFRRLLNAFERVPYSSDVSNLEGTFDEE